MVGERLNVELGIVDRTQQAAQDFLLRWTDGDASVWGRWTSVAAGALATTLAGLESISNRAQGVLRDLRQATGVVSPEQEQAQRDLISAGLSEADAAAAIAALAGPGGQGVGAGVGDYRLGRALGGISAAGGDPTAALQGAAGFGLQGAELLGSLNVGIGGGLASGADITTIINGVRNYGPVLSALGLNYIESANFIADLNAQGIDVSRVSPALNRFIRDSSAAGVAPRTAAAAAFESIRTASDIDAPRIGQEIFGAEGGLRLTQAIRSGRVGLGEQLIPDDLTNVALLESLADPTDREFYERQVLAAQLGGRLDQTRAFGLGIAAQVPFVGQNLSGGVGQILGIGEDEIRARTIGQDVLSTAVAEVLANAVQQGIQRAAEEGAFRTGQGQSYEDWLQQQAANR